MQPLEARVHPRVPFSDRVSVVASSSAAPLRLFALNLSEGGLCLQTAHPFRRGDRVGLRLRTDDGELAIPVTEVAWVLREVKQSSRIPAVGLRFLNLKPLERQQLRKLVEQLSHEPAPTSSSSNPVESLPPMHTEPSLPPLDASLPPSAETLPPDEVDELEPSLGPIPADNPSLAPLPADGPGWEFSDPNPERPRPTARKEREGHNNFVLAAGLLVVGTLAGMIFGLMDQSGKPRPQAAAPVEAAASTAEAALAAPQPVAARQAEPAPTPKAEKPAPAPRPEKPAVAARAPEKKAAPPSLPMPTHRPGTVSVGELKVSGRELILPVRGARAIERQFILKAPDRVVLDLTADAYEGPTELRGTASVKSVRVGRRPNGVRLVLDVKDAKTAAAAKVTRKNGVVAVVLPR